MSDTYTILYDPSDVFYKYALVTPDGTVCNWSTQLDNLSIIKGDTNMQSDDYWQSRRYCKLTIPITVTTEQQLLDLYPELLI